MKRVLGCLIFLSIMITSQIFAGTVYYVDVASGNDLNNGLSPATAWKTISKINNSSFSPGDYIYFKRGEIWREKLIVPSSGSSGNPITFGAYGNGNDPIINGADLITNWSLHGSSPHIWKKTDITIKPNNVWFDGTRGHEESSLSKLDAKYDWYWDSHVLYIYSQSDPDTSYRNPGFGASIRDWCFLISRKSYINTENLSFYYAKSCGFEIYNGNTTNINDFTIDGCSSVKNYKYAFFIYTDSTSKNINNGWIKNCTAIGNGSNGIKLCANGSSWTIENNIIHDNCILNHTDFTAGIKCDRPGLSNVIIQNNIIYNEGHGATGDKGLGIWVDTVGSGFIIRYNDVYNNRHHNIAIEYVAGAKVYYNLCYGSSIGAGIVVARDCDKCEVYNNVCYGNDRGIVSRGDGSAYSCTYNVIKNNISSGNTVEFQAVRGGENDGTNGYGNVYDYNCFGTESSNFIEWGEGIYKSTYSEWETAYGSSTSSINADPSMTNPGDGNFTLKLNSTCIDAGIHVGLAKDYEGNAVPQGYAPEIGAYEYQDEVPGKPVVSFAAYPIEGIPPLEVSFDASASYDPDGNITSYEWDFGDGNTGSGITVNHTYQNRGTFTAKLTVTDNDEQSASDSQEIKVGTPPVALFEAFPSSGNSPLKVELDASYSYDTDGEVVSYDWDFGDGTQGNSKNVNHTYYKYGTYTPTLKITDNDGLFDVASKEISVAEMPFPPLNIKVKRMTNRGNSSRCFCRIEWSKNPQNTARHNIVKYRIYRKIRSAGDNTYALIHEVRHHTFRYDDRSLEDIKELNLYTYAVSAVDDKNRESALGKPTLTQ